MLFFSLTRFISISLCCLNDLELGQLHLLEVDQVKLTRKMMSIPEAHVEAPTARCTTATPS
jgi:hypothetical protein